MAIYIEHPALPKPAPTLRETFRRVRTDAYLGAGASSDVIPGTVRGRPLLCAAPAHNAAAATAQIPTSRKNTPTTILTVKLRILVMEVILYKAEGFGHVIPCSLIEPCNRGRARPQCDPQERTANR